MIFLLDTDICSAHMRRPAKLAHRFIQYAGQLSISTVTLGELLSGAHNHPNPARILNAIADLRSGVDILDFDTACAEKFGAVRGYMLRKGFAASTADLQIASTALMHDLTLVTHNTADYFRIPNLRLDDWLIP
jgi:tRNA(fMet)-specific endonuclease VapC